MFDRMSGQFETLDEELRAGSTAVDLVETDQAYVVRVDLPGYDREAIDVELAGQTLTVSADRTGGAETADESDEGTYIRRERRQRSVDRSVRLPGEVDEEATEAQYENGVLTVELPKRHAGADGRDIPIN